MGEGESNNERYNEYSKEVRCARKTWHVSERAHDDLADMHNEWRDFVKHDFPGGEPACRGRMTGLAKHFKGRSKENDAEMWGAYLVYLRGGHNPLE